MCDLSIRIWIQYRMLDIQTRIRTYLNPSKRIRFRIRSENIRSIFIPSPYPLSTSHICDAAWNFISKAVFLLLLRIGMKMVRIFSDHIRNRIRLEGLRSVRIQVRISNIRCRIRIRILKLHIYDVDIQSYPIRHS